MIMKKDIIFLQINEDENELPAYEFDDSKDYALLILGKPRMREDIYDLAVKVTSAGNRLLVNIDNMYEFAVHNDKDILSLCQVLSVN